MRHALILSTIEAPPLRNWPVCVAQMCPTHVIYCKKDEKWGLEKEEGLVGGGEFKTDARSFIVGRIQKTQHGCNSSSNRENQTDLFPRPGCTLQTVYCGNALL